MADYKAKMQQLLDAIKQQRDELNVQAQLAKMEARDELQELEKKWDHFKAEADKVIDAAEDSGEDVGEALELLGEELKKGYVRIQASFKDAFKS